MHPICVTETSELNMSTFPAEISTGSVTEAHTEAPEPFTPVQRRKSLYVAPPRFDIEGWIFISLLTAFTGALAVLVLAR